MILMTLAPFSAPAEEFLVLHIPATSSGWGTEVRSCTDGTTASFVTSRQREKEAAGVLQSRDFDPPNQLSFWVAGGSRSVPNSVQLVDAATGEVYRRAEPPDSDTAVQVSWNLVELMGRRVRLQVEQKAAGDLSSWISVGGFRPAHLLPPSATPALMSQTWCDPSAPAERISVRGVPFLKGKLGTGPTTEPVTVALSGVRADRLYLLGGRSTVDRANPPWGGGSDYANTFVGDVGGTVSLTYRSGLVDAIPLVYGYTLFWRDPYNLAYEPFASDSSAFALLDDALCLAEAATTGSGNWFLPVALRDEPLEAITITGNPAREGQPQFDGLTLVRRSSGTGGVPEGLVVSQGSPEPALSAWLERHLVSSADPYPEQHRQAVAKLAHRLYTYESDVTYEQVRATRAGETPNDWDGPKVRFGGTPAAEIFTHVYDENAPGMLARLGETGMVHESAPAADYYGGFGGYRPGLQAFWPDAYTRGRTLMLAADMGMQDLVDRSLAFFDHWLMYFPYSYPENQIGGRPVPGHWTVIANRPHVYFDVLRDAGWPTRFTSRDFGNPENDGHGMLMLAHWRQWNKLGRPREWVEQRWTELNEAAEYLHWALDHPELSLAEHGLLYNESEGGMQKASIYCDVPCWLGLQAYADMAERAGHPDKAERWRALAGRMAAAIESYYPVKKDGWGEVWDADKSAGWFAGHAVLAPLLFAMDYRGLDPLAGLPDGWAERTRRTYRMQLTRNEPQWCAPAGLGYGQCYITQAALLLDEMADAEKMIEWLARFCFHPRHKHPFRVPEGVTMAGDGSVWRRWGDLGNLYQLAETVYVARLMAGVDDLNPAELRLMPRLPGRWATLEVKNQPVRTKSNGRSELIMLGARFHREPESGKITLQVETDKPVDRLAIRLGPFPAGARSVETRMNGNPVEASLFLSGDSKWAWVTPETSGATSCTVEAVAEVR